MSEAVDLDLDALDQELRSIPEVETHIWFEVQVGLALIQRLRKTEAELLNQQQLAADWQQRIAAMEQALQTIEDLCGTDSSVAGLRFLAHRALAAVEKP